MCPEACGECGAACAGSGWYAVPGAAGFCGSGTAGAGGLFFACHSEYRQAKIGDAVISRANVAQMSIAGCECPSVMPAAIEPAKTRMKNRWMRKVPNRVSGLAESPLGVTTNLLLRRSTVSISERA